MRDPVTLAGVSVDEAVTSLSDALCRRWHTCGDYRGSCDSSGCYAYVDSGRGATGADCAERVRADLLVQAACWELPEATLQLMEDCVDALWALECVADAQWESWGVECLASDESFEPGPEPLEAMSAACLALVRDVPERASCDWLEEVDVLTSCNDYLRGLGAEPEL